MTTQYNSDYRLVYYSHARTREIYYPASEEDNPGCLASILDALVDGDRATGGHIEMWIYRFGWCVDDGHGICQ